MQEIIDYTFRANPDFELVVFDRLPAEQRRLLEDLRKDPGFYGILRPKGPSAAGAKAVCRDTALLYLTLQEPGPIPAYAREQQDRATQSITQLVLDGVLMLEREAAWLTGPAALASMGPASAEKDVESDRIAGLSIEALRYASALRTADASVLAGRLYCYNSIPISARWRDSLPAAETLSPPKCFANEWSRFEPPPPNDVWIVWQRSRPQPTRASRAAYKLYLSPLPDAVPDAFHALVEAATSAATPQFKIGKSPRGWLRPDKIVAYCDSWSGLEALAAALTRRLRGCPSHGVPFTAALTPDGLLSWGADPLPDDAAPSWLQRESWRQRVSNHLASALAVAKCNPSPSVPAWRFAIERIRLDGVDPEKWCPANSEAPGS